MDVLKHEVKHLWRGFRTLFVEGAHHLFFVESDKGGHPCCDESVEIFSNLTTFHVACIRNELVACCC